MPTSEHSRSRCGRAGEGREVAKRCRGRWTTVLPRWARLFSSLSLSRSLSPFVYRRCETVDPRNGFSDRTDLRHFSGPAPSPSRPHADGKLDLAVAKYPRTESPFISAGAWNSDRLDLSVGSRTPRWPSRTSMGCSRLASGTQRSRPDHTPRPPAPSSYLAPAKLGMAARSELTSSLSLISPRRELDVARPTRNTLVFLERRRILSFAVTFTASFRTCSPSPQ